MLSVSVPLRNDGLSPGRIALSMQKAAPEVQAALRHAAKWLEDAGYRVEEAEPPRLEEAGRLFFTLVVSEGMASKEDTAGTSRMPPKLPGAAHCAILKLRLCRRTRFSEDGQYLFRA